MNQPNPNVISAISFSESPWRGRPVVLCATGRLPSYATMVDERLRPLFAFFEARIVGPGLYASDADFAGADLTSAPVAAAVEAAVSALGDVLPR